MKSGLQNMENKRRREREERRKGNGREEVREGVLGRREAKDNSLLPGGSKKKGGDFSKGAGGDPLSLQGGERSCWFLFLVPLEWSKETNLSFLLS